MLAVEVERSLTRDDVEDLLQSRPGERGRERPGAKETTRCVNRSDPFVASIVVRVDEVSPASGIASTSSESTT